MNRSCEGVLIREAVSSDAATLMGLYIDFFREDGISGEALKIQENVEVMMADARAHMVVAVEGERIVGFSSGSLSFGVEFGWAVELEDIFVQPAFRGRGIAAQLFDSVLNWGRANGASQALLVITPEAEGAQGLRAFYTCRGFTDSGRVTMYQKLA